MSPGIVTPLTPVTSNDSTTSNTEIQVADCPLAVKSTCCIQVILELKMTLMFNKYNPYNYLSASRLPSTLSKAYVSTIKQTIVINVEGLAYSHCHRAWIIGSFRVSDYAGRAMKEMRFM